MKRKLSALTAITLLLALAVLGTWGIAMYCVTSVAAEYAAERYLTNYGDFASTLANRSFAHWLGKGFDQKYANYDRNRMWEAADTGNRAESFLSLNHTSAEGDGGFLERLDSDNVDSTAAVYDGAGNLLVCGWEDFFYFEYLTEEQWTNREERSGNSARARFDREKLTEAGREMLQDSNLTFDAQALRLTGCFDGVEFTPKTIEFIDWDEFQDALFSRGSGTYTVSGVVEDDGLVWTTLYENPDTVPAGEEMVTFYSDWFDVCYFPSSPSFSYYGNSYDNLSALVGELGPELAAGRKNLARYEGLNLLIPSVNYCFSLDGETYYTPYFSGQEGYEDEVPQVHFYVVSAVYCSPWRTAFGELRDVYVVTFLLSALFVLLVRSAIKCRLTDPIRQISTAMTNDIGANGWRWDMSQAWREGQVLQEGFLQQCDTIRMQKNEITRLNTALEYAKRAEENRRQMTSNLAHELKTPLAVIHSYAEGLKEHVAEEKREKYMDVILSEVERTDSMVLELLDLSRLEAGKVKLSRDDFSILALTKAVFEKLDRTAQAKQLHLSFSFPKDFTLTADESRIAQVIENFATNAIKYTPIGGHVAVTIQNRYGKTTFTIENESEPLSEEALRQVWDTFYRAEESRSGGGTGLGLAIAKSIIELHGGKCSVRNTAKGVAFQFVI